MGSVWVVDIITRKHLRHPLRKGVKREYFEKEYKIYSEKEAKQVKIQYKDWKKCIKGDWGISDDGYVAECLKRKDYDKNTNIVFPYGHSFVGNSGKGSLEYLPHKKTGSYSHVSAKPHWELKKNRTQYKNFAKSYAIMMVNGDIDYETLGRIFDKDDGMPANKAKSLLKKEYMKEMVDKELEQILAKRDIDPGSVVDMISESFNVAKEKRDAANMLRSAENFVDMLGMKDKKKETKFDAIEGEHVDFKEIQGILNESNN
jgi:hypothetical protein